LISLLFVVGVESPTKLLFRVAHAVGTIVARGRVGGNTVTDTVGQAADDAKQVTNSVRGHVVGFAGQSIEHALAQFLIGCRRQV